MFAAIIGEVALGTVLKWYQYVGGVVAAGAVLLVVYASLRVHGPVTITEGVALEAAMDGAGEAQAAGVNRSPSSVKYSGD